MNTAITNKKTSFSEWVIRIVSFLLIVLSLVLIFFFPYIKIDGIKKRDVREMTNSLDRSIEYISKLQKNDRQLYDELTDNGFARNLSDYRRFISNGKKSYEIAKSMEFSQTDVVRMIAFTADFSARYEKYAKNSDDYFLEKYEEVEDVMDVSGVISAVIISFSAVFALLGVAAAILALFGKLSAFKYIYFAFVLIFVIVLAVGVPIFNTIIPDIALDYFPSEFQDIALKLTVFPFISVISSLASLLIQMCNKKINKRR